MREGVGVGAGCHRWYTKGGSVKCEAEAARATGWGTGAGAACGATTCYEVPTMEEG
jgi:hypothetical protein